MNNKPFQPRLVKPEATLFHEMYGIPEHRVRQLADEITRVLREMEAREEIDLPFAFDHMARAAETPEEYTFAVMTMTLTLSPHLRESALS